MFIIENLVCIKNVEDRGERSLLLIQEGIAVSISLCIIDGLCKVESNGRLRFFLKRAVTQRMRTCRIC